MMIPERYPDQIAGVLSCYDRMILQGTLPGWCYDQGMTAFLYGRQVKIKVLGVIQFQKSGLFQNLPNAAVPVQNEAQQISFPFFGCAPRFIGY